MPCCPFAGEHAVDHGHLDRRAGGYEHHIDASKGVFAGRAPNELEPAPSVAVAPENTRMPDVALPFVMHPSSVQLAEALSIPALKHP